MTASIETRILPLSEHTAAHQALYNVLLCLVAHLTLNTATQLSHLTVSTETDEPEMSLSDDVDLLKGVWCRAS